MEVQKTGDLDGVRRRYLSALQKQTGRNVIAYYSGWLAKPILRSPDFLINDADMTGFMTAINRMDRSRGLDIILHTPGGEINACEAIVNYLRYAFDGDIRAIVPHEAMSAGTMISLATKQVVMGMHSSLGPIDPQVMGAPAHGILDEFQTAQKAFKDSPAEAAAWLPILEKYTPTLIGKCEKAVKMAEKIVGDWLETGMLKGCSADEKETRKKKILREFGSHNLSLDHARHFGFQKVVDSGVEAVRLEDDKPLQDAVLSVHHAFTVTFMHTRCLKIIENQMAVAYIITEPLPQPPKKQPTPST